MLGVTREPERRGLLVLATDQGPGIAELQRALQVGCPAGLGLGIGVSGARRLMDRFDIESKPGRGTTVRMVKWVW